MARELGNACYKAKDYASARKHYADAIGEHKEVKEGAQNQLHDLRG
jgi:hypothetical protein